jgi:hypothetical protein
MKGELTLEAMTTIAVKALDHQLGLLIAEEETHKRVAGV